MKLFLSRSLARANTSTKTTVLGGIRVYLGDDTGHLWGTVQVIKPPKLIEISGPLFMSYPALSHLQYRLVEQGASTLLEFVHRAIGELDPEHCKGVQTGWDYKLRKVKETAEQAV